jgi:acyl-homoserine-lactone acylase
MSKISNKFKDPVVVLFLCGFTLLLNACANYQQSEDLQNHAVTKQSRNAKDAETLSKQVTIKRTRYGVPHIIADNIEAAGFGLGYVQMQDYTEKVVKGLLRARGEWAKYHDIASDEFRNAIDADAAHRLRYERAVKTWPRLSEDTRAMEAGFAEGVNCYVRWHSEKFSDLALPIFTGYDVHAREIGSPSRSSIHKFLTALKERKIKENNLVSNRSSINRNPFLKAGHSTIWAHLSAGFKEPNPDVGSNAWAFAPDRTTSGHAVLVRNPHLSWKAGYYEAKIKVPGKLNFYGDFRIGGPFGTVGGFNKHLGWATTNNYPVADEIYAFKVDPKNPDHYLLDGSSIPIHRETITVEFKNGKGAGKADRTFLSTPYGPVIYRGNGKVYIIKSAEDGEYRRGEQFMLMMKAHNLSEWKQAMRIQAKPSSNFTYADTDGNIFYVWNAAIPKLPGPWGGDTTAKLVTRSEQIWKNIIPWDSLPHLKNPKGGYLHNENDPFYYTNLNEIFDRDDFPSYFPKLSFGLRSQKSYELIRNRNQKLSLQDIIKRKYNEGMLLADRVKGDLVTAVQNTDPTGEVAKAIDLIVNWDNTASKRAREAYFLPSGGGVMYILQIRQE